MLKDRRGDKAMLALIANKKDLEDKREVSQEAGLKLAEELDALHVEVSAMTGEKVFDLFRTITSSLVNDENFHIGPETDLKLNQPKETKKKKKLCCK